MWAMAGVDAGSGRRARDPYCRSGSGSSAELEQYAPKWSIVRGTRRSIAHIEWLMAFGLVVLASVDDDREELCGASLDVAEHFEKR